MVWLRILRRWLVRLFLALAAIIAITYLGDSLFYLLRGSPTSTVTVSQFMSTPLKGNKIEYDFLGRVDAQCAESLYPRKEMQPCWYLRRDPNTWVVN